MAIAKLTTRTVASLRPRASRYEVFDKDTPGLVLRVTPQGRKTWALFYRVGGRLRRLTLGTFPDIDLSSAREKAHRARVKVFDAVDPAIERAAAHDAAAFTIAKLVTLYAKEPTTRQKASWSEEDRVLKRDVLPAWGNRSVSSIRRADVRELVNAKAVDAPVMANRLQAHVSHLLNYALDLEIIDANPAARLKKTPTRSRERVLSRDETAALWAYVLDETLPDRGSSPGWSETMRDLFAVLLATGQRLGEVARMKWADVDLAQRWWSLPATATKNARAHRVPLSAPVVSILTRRRPEKDEAVTRQVYALSTIDGSNIYDRSRKAMAALCRAFVTKDDDGKAIKGGAWDDVRAHDLRRTVATNLGELGTAPHVISAILNHTDGSITAVYNRFKYDVEKRQALERWAARMAAIASDKRGQEDAVEMAAAAGWM